MNRREVLGTTAAALLFGQALAQTTPTKVKITQLEKLKNLWDDAEFTYQGEACVLVRVPEPSKPNPRLLEHQKAFYSAYSRTCTHLGCRTQLPNGLRQLECGCHGSLFNATDGSVVAGPATTSLRGIKLEVEEGVLVAVGWIAEK